VKDGGVGGLEGGECRTAAIVQEWTDKLPDSRGVMNLALTSPHGKMIRVSVDKRRNLPSLECLKTTNDYFVRRRF
jgi:hypothetical protein